MIAARSLGPALRLCTFAAATVAAAGAALSMNHASGFDQPFAKHQAKVTIRTLPDGGRIAVGSRTGHDVTVRWRAPGASTWSAPDEIQRSRRLWTGAIPVDQRDGTVAIAPAWFFSRVGDGFQMASSESLTVCRNYRCGEPRKVNGAASTTISDDGHYVFFLDLNEEHVVVWEDGHGYRESAVRGISEPERQVLPLSDGTFVGVAGRWDGSLCRFVLYTADRGSTTFHKAFETPGFSDAKPCHPSAEVKPNHVVNVWTDTVRENIQFRRSGTNWRLDPRAPSRMQIPETGGESSIDPVEVGVGRAATALIGSRDGTTILAQIRASPHGTWGKERLLARASAGMACRKADAQGPLGKRTMTMVLVHCYRADRVVKNLDTLADEAIVLATTDGQRWISSTLARPFRHAASSRDSFLALGASLSLLYQGGGSFTTVRLPVDPRWDGVGLTMDGTRLLRIPGNGNPAAQCVATATMAPLSATSWPTPTPFVVRGLPRSGTCKGSIDEYASAKFGAGIYQDDWLWEGELQLRKGHLERAPRPHGTP
jgi:hypothetical protein